MARILVVNDSPLIARMVGRLVCDLGHKVHFESDGAGVLAALRTFGPDLLLLDMRLPNVNGFELLVMIRQKDDYAELPIVIMSGLTDEADIQQALNFGADDYLTKPIRNDVLLTVITHQLAR